MVEVDIAKVKLDSEERAPIIPIVILREKKGNPRRLLPIYVGIFEALAIITELENHTAERPMTHDLLKSVIDSLGAKVVSVLVSDIKERTFYAEIILDPGDEDVIAVDSRPSDALALAIRVGAPIYVSEKVMAESSISPENAKLDDKEHLKSVLEDIKLEDLYKV